MQSAALEQLQRRFFVSGLFLVLVVILVAVLLVQTNRVSDEAHRVSVELYRSTMYRSAASLRELWELNGRPGQMDIDGMTVGFSASGVPVVKNNGKLDCGETWRLFNRNVDRNTPQIMNADSYMQKGDESICFYKFSGQNLLALRYESGRIMINEFLTLDAPQK